MAKFLNTAIAMVSAVRLGELVGVDSSTIRSWELGARIRSKETEEKLNMLLENNKPLG